MHQIGFNVEYSLDPTMCLLYVLPPHALFAPCPHFSPLEYLS